MKTIVIGAGTAGCLVARRLSDAGDDVVLIEAGSGEPFPPSIRTPNWLGAQSEPGWHWPKLTATRTSASLPTPYLRGRGLGGSSSINGMLTTFGPIADYEAWPISGVRAAIERVSNDNPTVRIEPGAFSTMVCERLDDAGWSVGPAPLALSESSSGLVRRSSTRYLEGAPSIEVLPNVEVDRLILGPAGVQEVEFASGERCDGDRVVLCAGAIATPVLLLNSGIRSDEIGRGAADHPSIAVTYSLDGGAVASGPAHGAPPISMVAEREGVQVLVMDHIGTRVDDQGLGVITIALLDPDSSGSIGIDRQGQPLVDLNMLSAGDDRRRLVGVCREVIGLVEDVPHVRCLEPIPDGATEASEWVDAHLGPYSHVASSCGLGRALDSAGNVHGVAGLRVIDSSALPHLPRTNPMLPTLVLAEALAGVACEPNDRPSSGP